MSTISPTPNNRHARRLPADTRLLCLVGVSLAAMITLGALFLVPCLWAHRELKVLALLNQPCLLKAATGVPCPFCGATRSAVAAARGRITHSLKLSPLGIPLVWGGIAVGSWLLACAVSGRDLGLRAIRRLAARARLGRILLACLALLWAFKIIADCLLKWG